MKKAALLFFFCIGTMASAQSDVHKKATELFIEQFNNGDFEGIYQSFSPNMKKARTKKQYFAFLSKVKKDQGKLLFLKPYDYRILERGYEQGSYEGNFENDKAFVRITTNEKGEIIGLYIKKAVIF